jgi:uracil-DNA glycosylase family 4
MKDNAAQAFDPEPSLDCGRCNRLQAFRADNQAANPNWFNRPVRGFGDPNARLLIIGLAPGLRGANRTGRPFTGDWAGDLLFATLLKFGFATGTYEGRPDDGLRLKDAFITNAVRCVPPQNKPVGSEIANCRPFLEAQIRSMTRLEVLLVLGRIAHDSTLSALGEKRSAHPFGHNAEHRLEGGLKLVDSYHCSRYNTNTRRLTVVMFERVFGDIRRLLES